MLALWILFVVWGWQNLRQDLACSEIGQILLIDFFHVPHPMSV